MGLREEPRSEAGVARIADVARLAGVSVGTVSKALNGLSTVHPVLREKVIAAAAELGYQPHPLAQALRTGRTRTIALTVALANGITIAPLIDGASDEAYAADYALSVAATRYRPDLEHRQLALLIRRRVAAIIAYSAVGGAEPYSAAQRAGIPVVFADSRPEGVEADLVTPDYREGVAEATRYLLAAGRRRVALMTTAKTFGSNRERAMGYRLAHAEQGVPLAEGLVVSDLFNQGDARSAVLDLLDQARPPDALIVGVGRLAVGALAGLRQRGVRVPDDIAVVGTGDNPWASLVEPALSMIQIDGEAYGRTVVRTALERVGRTPMLPPGRTILLPAPFLRRSST
jgi:LacI family transcriptional regulator